jgi:hypothetical protein
MLRGKRFRLKAETVAIETIGDKRRAIQVPAGSVITIKSGPTPDEGRFVEVQWDGHIVVMFAVDIQKRGEQIS